MNTTTFAAATTFRTIPCPNMTATVNGRRVVGCGPMEARTEHTMPEGVAWREFFMAVTTVVCVMAGATVATGGSTGRNPFDGMA
jgi:hypothetical protein